MASITSASTDAQVEAAYDDNAGFREDQDVAKAKTFVTACRILLRRLANSMGKGGAVLSYNRELIQKQLEEATAYIAQYTTDSDDIPGPRVTRVDFRGTR